MIRSVGRYVSWLWRSSSGMRLPLVLNVLAGCASVALNLCFIALTKRLVDLATGALPSEGTRPLIYIALLLVGVMLVRLGVNAYASRLENITYSKMNFLLRKRTLPTPR